MSSVGLLFVGAVLFMNGLLFLGKADVKGVAVFNLFVGGLQTAVPFYLIATAHTPNDILSAAGIFLFGFTYLYVGIVNLAGFKADGIGWYSLWVAALAAGFGLTTILRFHDTPTGLLWLQWAVLWALFFVVLALGFERLTLVAGWLTLILSLTTCTIPGFLLLLGDWGKVPTWAVIASIVATAVAVIVAAIRTVPAASQPAAAAGDLGVAVPN
ncbi:MAG TPA: AmiS/UreI family transporter [Mycobacterium sp.]|uniref:AmiS/UreI family transporter n=1 Tax=Mycobacterium sp. TaxID=1785 RepID=UPI002D44E062|nr:AmiS/UreI family transporter [Mycobacterium sp.]HZU46988.1 AmiS/UreI family transporter [Mycobacterium sp.]